jgi:hypothetical protein
MAGKLNWAVAVQLLIKKYMNKSIRLNTKTFTSFAEEISK